MIEPNTSIIGAGEHVYTRVGRYSVHTDMLMFESQAYVGQPREYQPILGTRFKAIYSTPEEMHAGHGRIVEHVMQLPQNPKHDIPLWITRDEQNTRFEREGYKKGLTGKHIAVASDDIPFEGREAWLAGYRRGRADQLNRNWHAIRNGLTDTQYQRLLSWGEGEDKRRLDPQTARFEDFPTPLEWAVSLHLQLGRPDPRRIADYYTEYIERALWRIVIRPRILQRDSYVCWRCRCGANEVHHASYHPLVMAGLADEWLFSVCGRCHEGIHSDDSSHAEQWRRLNARVNKRGLPLGRWKSRINLGPNLPTSEQLAWWRTATAQGEVDAFRHGMERVRQRLEIAQDWTLERALTEVGL